MPLSYQRYCEMVNELAVEIEDHDFTDWERGFIESVADYPDQGRLFSDAQKETIQKLHNQYL